MSLSARRARPRLHHVRELPGAPETSLRSGPCRARPSSLMLIAPRSCSTASAAIVQPRTRSRAAAGRRGTRVQAVDGADHLLVLGGRRRAVGNGRGSSTRGARSARLPLRAGSDRTAAAALDVVGMHGAAGDRVERLLERRRLAEAVGVQRHLDVVALGDGERGVDDRAGSAPMSSCTLKPPAPQRQQSSRNGSVEALRRARAGSRFIGTARQASSSRSKLPARVDADVPDAAVAHRRRTRRARRRERRRRRAAATIRCTWESTTPGVAIRPSPGIDRRWRRRSATSRRPIVSGLPARPIAGDPSVLDADRGLADAQDRVDHDDVRDARRRAPRSAAYGGRSPAGRRGSSCRTRPAARCPGRVSSASTSASSPCRRAGRGRPSSGRRSTRTRDRVSSI